MGLAPVQAPDALQDVAFVDVQASVDGCPCVMVCGDAVNATEGICGGGRTGIGTATLVALALPAVFEAVTTEATEVP